MPNQPWLDRAEILWKQGKLLLDIKWLKDLPASKGFAYTQLPIMCSHNAASFSSFSSFPITSSTNESPWQRQRKKYSLCFTINFNNVIFLKSCSFYKAPKPLGFQYLSDLICLPLHLEVLTPWGLFPLILRSPK